MSLARLPEVIKSERLTMQRLCAEDADQVFYAYASKPEATRYMAWPTHESIKDTRAYLNYALTAWDLGLDFSYSVKLKGTGRIIGGWGAIHEEGKIQFGYVLSPTHWGQGFATEICRHMLPHLRALSGVFRIGTFVDAENVASLRVLAKCGLVEEAYLPKWFRFINQGNVPKDCILFRLPLP